MELVISYKKSLEENASIYFDKAKKAKKKREGAKGTLVKYEKELNKLKTQEDLFKQELLEKEQAKKTKKDKPKRWYHKFRWFKTSDNLLVIGGRDASSNELVIKKHAEPDDLVFHTDMAGSPFFVLKTEGKEVTEATLREVADATCTFSRAWKLNLTAQSVFCVKPDQVQKEGGLKKGAFMIYGRTKYIENQVNLALGITDQDEIMSGPEEAIAKHCKKYLTLTQDSQKASEIAKIIQKHLGGDLDEIIRALPAGNFKLEEVNT